MIKRSGSKWLLYTSDGSRVLGVHKSEEDAKRQETAINMSKARKAGDKVPPPRR